MGRKRTGAGVSGPGRGAARDVEQLAALLVAEAAEWLEQLERGPELGHVHHAPAAHVPDRRRPERGEVAAQHLGARLDRVLLLRLVERDEAAFGARVPESGLVVVHEVRSGAGGTPGTPGGDPCETRLALERRDPSALVTGPSAASERASSARLFACDDSQGKFVSLIAARISA